MTTATYRIDTDDLLAAIALLEDRAEADNRFVYELSRITNPTHAIVPFGDGVGVTVRYWATSRSDGYVAIFEKAGHNRSITAAVEKAIARLDAKLAEAR